MKSLQNLSYKTLFTILFFSLAGIIFFIRIGRPVQKVSAAWWDEMWHYRKAINIGYTGSNNITNAQIKIISNYDVSNLVTTGKLQPNLDDIRFTDINGNLIKYWIEDSTLNSIDIWGDVPNIFNPNTTIYMYYGNDNATGVSNSSNLTIGGVLSSIDEYRIHTFKSSGIFKNQINTNVEVLIVAGGGSGGGQGGNDGSGGGGAGGLIYKPSHTINANSNINVTVGNGGQGVPYQTLGKDGENSVFDSLTAIGGGGGGSEVSGARNGRPGGSGGGAGGYAITWIGGVGTSGQGNKGGNNVMPTAPNKGGGGGGGAGTPGIDGGFGIENHLSGGEGVSYSISGIDISYAGGGGDGGGYGGYGGLGGNGGGGKGGSSIAGQAAGTSGTPNTGGGGGGGGGRVVGGVANSGSGGSGIVIVRYLNAFQINQSSIEETGTGPIAYWKFDEGVGATAYDSTGTNHGTISGATWISENQCISEKCLSFDDTQNNYVLSSSTIPISSSQTYSVWVKPVTTSSLVGILTTHNYADTSNIGINITGGKFAISIGYTDGTREYDLKRSNFTIPTNKWTHVGLIYNHTENSVSFYINGKFDNKWILNKTVKFLAKNILVGQWSNNFLGSYKYNGLIDEPKIYPYARTADQIKQDYNSRGSVNSSSTNLGIKSNTAPSIKSSLIAHYKFDEGSGTTTNDSSENKNNLTFGVGNSSPVWSTNSKTNKALSFNGLTTYIENNSNNDVFNLVNNLTVSAWVNPSSFSGSSKYIFGHYYQYGIYLTSSGTYEAILRGNDGTYYYPTSSKTLNLNEWQYLTLSFNEGEASLFINGKFINSSTIPTTTLYNTSTDLITIGSYFNGSRSNNFNGLIDEVKIYNRALTPEEVKQDYNAGSAIQFGSTSQSIGGTTTSLEYCIPGDTSYCASPVAEWNFEENTGTTAKDTSGNNNNGTIGVGSSAPTWSLGQNNKGAGLKFDGVSNRLPLNSSINLNSNANWTVSAWVKTNSAGANPVLSNKDSGPVYNDLRIYNSKISYYHYNGAWINETGNINVANGQWNYLTWVNHNNQTMDMYVNGIADTLSVNSALSTAGPVNQIGRDWAVTANATIDDVKIYNYARTPAQIAYDYNRGGPIGWWKLDECQGSTAFDSSGLGNTGVISIGQSGTQTTLGTCQTGTSTAWTNGSVGKINSSLNFDGVDDYINIGNSIPSFSKGISISVWAYPKSVKNWARFIDFGNGSQNNNIVFSRSGTSNSLYFEVKNGTSNGISVQAPNAIELNKWQNFIVTENDSGVVKLYKNGNLLITGNTTIPLEVIRNNNYIGRSNWSADSYYDGQIDDVRIYNYALTSEQVKTVYNNGAVNFN